MHAKQIRDDAVGEPILTGSIPTLPPTSEAPRGYQIRLPVDAAVLARVDRYSDRLRCDHPRGVDGEQLGEALREAAERHDCGRVVVMANADSVVGLRAAGYVAEARMPGFYRGETDCMVMGLPLDPERAGLSNPKAVGRVDALLAEAPVGRRRPPVTTHRATAADAEAIAGLIADTFPQYPTPSGVPGYVEQALGEGVPFRLVREGETLVSCASADLVPEARTAELTDCATRPEARGRGYMQAILEGLMDDLRGMDYPTAFTLARAQVPGVNLAFQRLGFELRGRMVQSCRIGEGIEDMNVWSRRLDDGAARLN